MKNVVTSATLASLILLSGCGDNKTKNSPLDAVPATGAKLPYTVMDNTIDDGAKPGQKMEIRNGGYGSAAAAHPTNKNQFYALTDRGPNAKFTGDHGKGKIFPLPGYTPRIGLFEIQSDGSVKKLKDILLKDTQGNPITGLPNTSAFGGTGETPYDRNGNAILNADGQIKTDDFGLDSEGLAVLKDGTFWISDEYGPHIVHYDANGKEIERINPFVDDTRDTMNLPAEFANRRANRGMEGLTITPDQKTLVGIMQSTMYNPSKAVKNLNITRIVSINLEDKTIKQYLYKQEKNQNANSEITALDNDTFLVIERDGSFYKGGPKPADPNAQKHVYKIKLSSGTDIEHVALDSGMTQDDALGLLINGKTLEEVVLDSGWGTLKTKGIEPVEKTLVLDMVKETGYPHDKMEGLIVFDNNTLGILNDDDFAMWSKNGVLKQKYLDANKTVIDGNTLYIMHNLDLGIK